MLAQRTKDEKKIVNLRPITLSAVALALGVGFCYLFLYFDWPVWVSVFALAIPLFFLILTPNKQKGVACLAAFVVFFVFGFFGFYHQINTYQTQPFPNGKYLVQGEVCSVSQGEEYSVLTLKDITFDYREASGKIQLYVYEETELTVGDEIATSTTVTARGSAYRYHTFRASMVVDDVRYFATVTGETEVTGHNFHLFATVAQRMKTVIYSTMGERAGGVAYAMTTGDTSGIDEELLTSIRFGGVAHLFAVSGMHIGVVYGLFSWVLKRTKAARGVKLLLPVAACFCFCAVCNFTPSSVRALVVLSVVALAKFFHVFADRKEVLSLSAIVLLIASPANLFSAGFLFSYLSYGGVALFAPVVVSFCGAHHIRPKPLLLAKAFDLLVTVVCVQLLLIPAQLVLFGYFPVWTFLLNVLLLPVFSVLFPFYLACLFVGCIFPFATQVAMFLPGKAFSLFVSAFSFVNFSQGLVYGINLGAACVAFYYATVFQAIKPFRLGVYALPLTAILASAFFGTAIMENVRFTKNVYVAQYCYYNDFCCAVVDSPEGQTVLVNGVPYEGFLSDLLFRRVDNVNDVAVVVASDDCVRVVNAFFSYGVTEFYLPYSAQTGLRSVDIHVQRQFTRCGVDYAFAEDTVVKLTCEGLTGVFNSKKYSSDFTLFYDEQRDGLIFCLKDGILSTRKGEGEIL